MGRGPLFGFDGGARACRTTHRSEASTWLYVSRKERSNETAKPVRSQSSARNGDENDGRNKRQDADGND
jgi:hypothetical protein